MVKNIQSLVGNNGIIVCWETAFDLPSLGIGVCATWRVSLAKDPGVRPCLLHHKGREGTRYAPVLDDFRRVPILITLAMEVFSKDQVKP